MRNQLYELFAEVIDYSRTRNSPSDNDRLYDTREHNNENVVSPRIPALLQTSRQLRAEFAPFYNGWLVIKCNDFSLWDSWAQSIGRSLLERLTELHLSMNVMVNLVYKERPPQKMAPATLRVRYDKGYVDKETKVPSVRFWFDLENDPDSSAFKADKGGCYSEDRVGWIILPSSLKAIGRRFKRRLPWDRSFDIHDVLCLTDWLSGDGVVSFCSVFDRAMLGSAYFRRSDQQYNTFQVQEQSERRDLTVAAYPPRSVHMYRPSINHRVFSVHTYRPSRNHTIIWERNILGGAKPSERRYYFISM